MGDVDVRVASRDFAKAGLLFLLVFASTFPVVLPFLFFTDAIFALRVSNAIAILMMFMCGWSVAVYSGINKWAMSLGLVAVGIVLVAIAIKLDG